jgi:PAS domain S-box-containing protein
MVSNRIWLLMIAASLTVIALVSGFLYKHQLQLHHEKVRVDGVAFTRVVSTIEYSQLLPGSAQAGLLRNLAYLQKNDDFAYGIVVNPAGKKIDEALSAGALAPPATMPAEPFGWFGEHRLVSPGDGRQIREFFAPVMKDGQLNGFVRAGYYSEPTHLLNGLVSSFGLMALPIFLLTTLTYFLIRREIRPLAQLSKKMEQVSQAYSQPLQGGVNGQDMTGFVQRFDHLTQLMESRMTRMATETAAMQTKTHLLSYKQEKAESALNSMPHAVLVIDDACIPTFANGKLEPILGVKHEEIVGRSPQDWCTDESVLAFLMRFRNALSAAPVTHFDYIPKENSELRIAVSAFPLFSPHDRTTVFGMLIVFRDVSKDYLAKKAGTEFVSHVSHELKTPLNTLSTYSELLLDYASLADSERVNAVNVIHDEVERMAGLINNLLNISKLETGALQAARKRVKLNELLQSAFDRANHHACGKGITLELDSGSDLGAVRLDKELFRIALDNLLSNAIKYSNPGGKVTLKAQWVGHEQIQIIVRDQGIGISPEDCAKVFLKYYRSDSQEATARSGHGLGLYLAKQIVSLHHGVLSVHSELGKGTEFIITFEALAVPLEESPV